MSLRRYSRIDHAGQVPETHVARFWAAVGEPTGELGCREWGGSRMASGYGQFYIPGLGETLAHRVSHVLATGEIPQGLLIRHRCDNRICVNPDHLETGTIADNSRDMAERGGSTRGERSASARLTERDVIEIRRRYAAGETQRSLAEEFGVDRSTVSYAISGRNWSYLKESA